MALDFTIYDLYVYWIHLCEHGHSIHIFCYAPPGGQMRHPQISVDSKQIGSSRCVISKPASEYEITLSLALYLWRRCGGNYFFKLNFENHSEKNWRGGFKQKKSTCLVANQRQMWKLLVLIYAGLKGYGPVLPCIFIYIFVIVFLFVIAPQITGSCGNVQQPICAVCWN